MALPHLFPVFIVIIAFLSVFRPLFPLIYLCEKNVDVITYRIYNESMDFEWDENKNQVNIHRHGIDFNDIPKIFDGPMIINIDDRLDYSEERYIGVGILGNLIAVVVFSEEVENITRIISARKANKYESKTFEKEIKNRLG